MYNDEINALKILLAQTDYVALKVAEAKMYGEDTTEFVEVVEKRRAWRRRINELELEAENEPELEAEDELELETEKESELEAEKEPENSDIEGV